jgi:hypothetical protein
MPESGSREIETDQCFPVQGFKTNVMGQDFEVKQGFVLTRDSESILELEKLKIYQKDAFTEFIIK